MSLSWKERRTKLHEENERLRTRRDDALLAIQDTAERKSDVRFNSAIRQISDALAAHDLVLMYPFGPGGQYRVERREP